MKAKHVHGGGRSVWWRAGCSNMGEGGVCVEEGGVPQQQQKAEGSATTHVPWWGGGRAAFPNSALGCYSTTPHPHTPTHTPLPLSVALHTV